MITRIIDKVIVLTVLLISYFAIITVGVGYDIDRIFSDVFVANVLMYIINSFVFELIKSNIMNLALVGINCVLMVLRPDIFILSAPAVLYGLVSMSGGLSELKNMGKRSLASLFMFCILIVVIALNADSKQHAVCLISGILAAVLAVKTAKGRQLEQKMLNSYDEARLEAMREHRLRELEMQNRENEVYVATLSERNRIAREIHDNVGHMLTRGVVQLQAINIMNKDENLKPMLTSVSDTVNEAMTSIRRSVHELHDDAIDLSVGINELIGVLDDRFEVKVNTMIESPASGKLKTAIIGVVKEALTNIAKYSKGNKVKVEIIENVTFWKVLVWDNGYNEPFEYNGENSSGIGLEHITTRAKSVGGRANISAGADGFTVSVVVPK